MGLGEAPPAVGLTVEAEGSYSMGIARDHSGGAAGVGYGSMPVGVRSLFTAQGGEGEP